MALMLTWRFQGPVTDYGSTVTHWIRNREARYQTPYFGEGERPTASYIVDVSRFIESAASMVVLTSDRCFLPLQG